MTTVVKARAFRVTESSLPTLQCFIKEPIPEGTKYILASSEGYLFFDQEPAWKSEAGTFRIPHLTMLSYYDIEYEND